MHNEESMPHGDEHSPQEVWEELESLKQVVGHIAEVVGYPLAAPAKDETLDKSSDFEETGNTEDNEVIALFEGADDTNGSPSEEEQVTSLVEPEHVPNYGSFMPFVGVEDSLAGEDEAASDDELDEGVIAADDNDDGFEISDSIAFARFDNESPVVVDKPEPSPEVDIPVENESGDTMDSDSEESSFDHEFFLTVKPEDEEPSTVHLVDEGKVYDTSEKSPEEESSVVEEETHHVSEYSLDDEEEDKSPSEISHEDFEDGDTAEDGKITSDGEAEFGSLPVEETATTTVVEDTEKLEESPVIEFDEEVEREVSTPETIEEAEANKPATLAPAETSEDATREVTSVGSKGAEKPEEVTSTLRGEVIHVDTSTTVFSLASKESQVVNTTATKENHQTRHLPPLRRPGSVLPTRPGQQTEPRREPPKLQLPTTPKASTNKHSGLRIFGRTGITGARASQPRNSQREFA